MDFYAGQAPYTATISVPQASEWSVRFMDITYRPRKGHEPHWLGRLMCWWLLGAKWTKG